MAEQEKLNNPEDKSQETPEQKAMSEQLRKMAEDEDKNNNERDHKEEVEKMVDQIRERVANASEKVKKIAEVYLGEIDEEKFGIEVGLSKLYSMKNEIGNWIENPEDVQSLPKELTIQEREELYGVFYGETPEQTKSREEKTKSLEELAEESLRTPEQK